MTGSKHRVDIERIPIACHVEKFAFLIHTTNLLSLYLKLCWDDPSC